MSHDVEVDGKFLLALAGMDAVAARDVQAAGCPQCGAPLDVATYSRKPRGLGALEEVEKAFSFRESFCCRLCRKRTTPPALRFLGRKVYIAIVVVLACVAEARVAAGAVVLEVPGRTVRCWRMWWTKTLLDTAFWIEARSRFSPALDESSVPVSIVERFGGPTATGLQRLLHFTKPITTSSWKPSMPMDA